MKIEYYTFFNQRTRRVLFGPRIKRVIPVSEIRQELPDSIARQLGNPPLVKNDISLYVDSQNVKAIEYVETALRKHGFDFGKRKHIEVTADEIDIYNFFYVGLRTLDWGKEFYYDFSGPTCKSEACPIGAEIRLPFYLNANHAGTFAIARAAGIWDVKVRFVLSEELKVMFDAERVSGLKYDECLIGDKTDTNRCLRESCPGKYYLAETTSSICEEADDVCLDSSRDCRKHSVLFAYDGLSNRRLPCRGLSQSDFQAIDRVMVKEKQYYYRMADFVISKRMLKILMDHAPRDIHSRSVYFEKGLTPVVCD